MKRVTRVGVIGAGQIVENAHLPVLLNLPDVEVCWLADASLQRARLLAKMYGVPARDIEGLPTLLGAVDACLIATPVGARNSYLDACAARGVAVLTEKPFAISEAAHRSICERFPSHKLAVSLQRRFYRSVAAVTQLLADAPFGKLERVDLAIGGFDLKSGGPQSYLANPRLSGGGVVMDLGVHALDQVLVATGTTDVTTERVRSIALDGIDYDVNVDGVLTTPAGGVPVHAEMTRLRPIDSGFTFTCEHATLTCGIGPESNVAASPRSGGPPMGLNVSLRGATTSNQAFFALWRAFFTGLANERPGPASACNSVLTSRWMDQIHERVLA